MIKWHPMFDASRERVDVVPTSVRLPSLPFPFWTMEHFMHIGNLLGNFLEVDFSFNNTSLKRVARILVSINIRNGLPGAMRINWKEYSHLQTLDYENVPFCYRRCHEYGHLAIDCPLASHCKENKHKEDINSISGGEGDISAPSSPPISLVGLDLPSMDTSATKAAPPGELHVAA